MTALIMIATVILIARIWIVILIRLAATRIAFSRQICRALSLKA
jgi:hypothetical protein